MDDELWELIEPLLPPWPRKAPGPRSVDDRRCLQGILYVLYNDVTWQLLPLELGFGSGQTCWRRLARRRIAGLALRGPSGYTYAASPSDSSVKACSASATASG